MHCRVLSQRFRHHDIKLQIDRGKSSEHTPGMHMSMVRNMMTKKSAGTFLQRSHDNEVIHSPRPHWDEQQAHLPLRLVIQTCGGVQVHHLIVLHSEVVPSALQVSNLQKHDITKHQHQII